MTRQVCTPGFGEFLPFFSADPLRLCQVGWGPSVDIHFRSPELFDWVQVRALAEPLNDIHIVVPKPLLLCLSCILRVIVLLEAETSAQSEVLSAQDQVFY